MLFYYAADFPLPISIISLLGWRKQFRKFSSETFLCLFAEIFIRLTIYFQLASGG